MDITVLLALYQIKVFQNTRNMNRATKRKKSTTTAVNFSTHSINDKNIQNLEVNKKTWTLLTNLTQLSFIERPIAGECTFFSNKLGKFDKIDHIMAHKVRINKFISNSSNTKYIFHKNIILENNHKRYLDKAQIF